MPTNDHLFFTAATAWLRAQVDRVRRSVMSQRPAVRWSIAVLVVIGLTSAIYWAAASYSTLGVRYLVSGRRFSSDDLIKVCTALDKQRVNYRVDDSRRVEVAADQYDQAADVVAKLEFGQRPIGDIRDSLISPDFLDSPVDREIGRQLAREKIIEGLIGQLDGVVWSLVSINRQTIIEMAPGRARSRRPSFTSRPREIGNYRIRPHSRSPAILTGCVSDLTPGSITVMDRRGFRYFDSGNLAIGDASRDRAREEDLVKEILDKLDWVKGVRVQVKVSSPAEPAVSLVRCRQRCAPAGRAPSRSVAPRPSAERSSSNRITRSPSMRVNQAPTRRARAGPLPASPASVAGERSEHETQRGAAIPGTQNGNGTREPGHVLIYVPRSFYLNADIRPDNREPTRDELRSMTERTENQIQIGRWPGHAVVRVVEGGYLHASPTKSRCGR